MHLVIPADINAFFALLDIERLSLSQGYTLSGMSKTFSLFVLSALSTLQLMLKVISANNKILNGLVKLNNPLLSRIRLFIIERKLFLIIFLIRV
tara:strand:- start:1451 stop:1732 length:282 start_codon:yes stop_codon:yes gene_type:complete